ncbi:hypothetical protein J5J10_15350 [Ciceribacter sp. L1K23]|uniref:hypothetical protein n=1 Tax=Ciceribacter sp. L1K23 TaxID=2820276 RepID=UPI001B8236A5|nr:hypothetical protein [Ciceribacter sp. L1K23]MBR0557063.1 hypothetical protein [Ciceribacter sp. L1K23]
MRDEKRQSGKGATDTDLEKAVSELLTELKTIPVPAKIMELAEELQKRLDDKGELRSG